MSADMKKDIRSEARNFSASLSNVFLLKRRDPQSKHLLEKAQVSLKAQHLIDGLLAESPRPLPATPPPRTTRGGGGMGQLWVKLDELKRENDDLKRQRARSSDDKAGSPKSPKSPKSQASPGHVDALSADLQRAKTENESLKAQIEKLQKTVKEHQTLHATLQDEYKRSKVALEAAQKSAMKAREDTKKMEATLQSLKAENEALKQKISHAPPAQTTPVKPHVSSPKPKIRTDNRMTENIGEKCRPSNIAVAYTTLESQEWMDAKESLEDSDEEEAVTKFLCDVLMSSFHSSAAVLQKCEKVIGHLLANPTAVTSMVDDSRISSSVQIPDDVSDLVCQKYRASFDRINTDDLAEMVKRQCDPSSPLLSHWPDSVVQRYIHECCALSWQMAIQKPSMKLCTRDSRFDSGKHKLWWSCDQSKAKRIDYFIWPVLYDYEGGNMMVKGCVHAS